MPDNASYINDIEQILPTVFFQKITLDSVGNTESLKVNINLNLKDTVEKDGVSQWFAEQNMQKYISTNHEIEGIPEKYFHSYVAGATISTVKFWVNDPHRLSVEDLTNHIFKIIYSIGFCFIIHS